MQDLTDVLIEAQNKNYFWSKDKLHMLINQNVLLQFDWDRECGERWASIMLNNKFAGYISCFVPLCFCKVDFAEEMKSSFKDEITVIIVKDFDEKRWYIDDKKLIKNLNGFMWIIEEEVLNIKRFSINDLWYATI